MGEISESIYDFILKLLTSVAQPSSRTAIKTKVFRLTRGDHPRETTARYEWSQHTLKCNNEIVYRYQAASTEAPTLSSGCIISRPGSFDEQARFLIRRSGDNADLTSVSVLVLVTLTQCTAE